MSPPQDRVVAQLAALADEAEDPAHVTQAQTLGFAQGVDSADRLDPSV